ncbi:hypothetical protein GE21DRAFT_1099676 [Neurospora crassa]|nr:hypothetical protein GE21DRAFT_1099676 [Neurospora crassa]
MPSFQGRWRVETFKAKTRNRKKGIHLMFSTFCFVVLLPVHLTSRHDAAFGQKICHATHHKHTMPLPADPQPSSNRWKYQLRDEMWELEEERYVDSAGTSDVRYGWFRTK